MPTFATQGTCSLLTGELLHSLCDCRQDSESGLGDEKCCHSNSSECVKVFQFPLSLSLYHLKSISGKYQRNCLYFCIDKSGGKGEMSQETSMAWPTLEPFGINIWWCPLWSVPHPNRFLWASGWWVWPSREVFFSFYAPCLRRMEIILALWYSTVHTVFCSYLTMVIIPSWSCLQHLSKAFLTELYQ